jgi:hypothetical protein
MGTIRKIAAAAAITATLAAAGAGIAATTAEAGRLKNVNGGQPQSETIDYREQRPKPGVAAAAASIVTRPTTPPRPRA